MDNFNLTPIKALNDKDIIQDRVFLVKDKNYGLGKNGKPFISLLIGDRSGQIDSRIWDNAEVINEQVHIGDLVKIKGAVQLYNSKKQIVIHRIENVTSSEYAKEDYIIEGPRLDTRALYAQLMVIIDSMESDYIKQLSKDCLGEEDVKELLLSSPAAKSIHHARRGGLLQHIVSIAHLMNAIAVQYSELNRDLLLFGAIFHDFGKIWELEVNKMDQTGYSFKGQMLGHIYLCCEFIEKKMNRILGFPDDLRTVLKHIVLSHHGKLEYGSPKVPLFIEAFVVAAIDDFDSKMDQIFQIVQSEQQSGEAWSRYSEHFERYFYAEKLKGKW